MANDYNYIIPTGTIVPDTSVVLQEVQDEFRTTFGADLDVSPSTPQGVLIVGEALSRESILRNNAALANQINPNIAGGIFLDAICGMTGLQRSPATRSTVTANLTGVPNTIIPAGVQARTTGGDVFESVATVVLSSGGTASVVMQSIDFGPITAPINTLTQIVSGILGWETVTNPSSATLGELEQSDTALRKLRNNTLALQNSGTPEAITSGVYLVPNVRSLAFLENVENTTQVIEGISLVAHSIFVCVDGGTDLAVATAILANKDGGCNYNGNTTVDVVEPTTGQDYAVKFERPEEIDILIRVTVSLNGTLVDPDTAVPEAVMAYVNGELPNEAGFVVGGDVSPFEIGAAINSNYPTLYIKKVEVAVDDGSPTYSTDDIAIAKNQVPRTTTGSITVVTV